MPSAAVSVLATTEPPDCSRSSTVTPGSPSSSSSTSPGVPPPGLKSRQTTPVMPPASASGTTACSAPSGTSDERIAVSPSCATAPGSSGSFSTSPPSGPPVSDSVDGRALERTPAGLTASFTTAIVALIVPWLGSFSYMNRQITPAANSEIAIGMKTATLNAVEKRIRSSSTAKTSPIAVTNAGTTRSHRKLFLIAVRSVSSLKSVS